MKIIVLNGSPKGEQSITLQYCNFIQKKFPQHELKTFHIAQRIKRIEKSEETFQEIIEEITKEVAEIKEQHGVVPGLVTILVGENPASMSYVTLKIQTAHRVGFKEVQDSQPDDLSEEDLLALIDKYNNDDAINGILVDGFRDKESVGCSNQHFAARPNWIGRYLK